MIDFENLGQHAQNAARASLQRNASLQMLLDEFIPSEIRNIVEQLLLVMYVAGYAQAGDDNDERMAPLTRDEVDRMVMALRSAAEWVSTRKCGKPFRL